jgi:hypothetical protein
VTQDPITVTVPKKANLVFQVQNIPSTDVWAVIEKGELLGLVEKARLYNMESRDRLAYEAERISRELALANPVSLEEMIAADINSKKGKGRTAVLKEGVQWHE